MKRCCERVICQFEFWFFLVLTFINILLTNRFLEGASTLCIWSVIVGEVFAECGILGILHLMNKKGVPVEKRFLFAAVILGILFMLILPPGQSPDDTAHFVRAYGVSEGKFIPDVLNEEHGFEEHGLVGSEVPVEVVDILALTDSSEGRGVYEQVNDGLWKTPSGNTTPYFYNTAAVYNFVCYLPQTVGIIIGKILGGSVMWMAYFARFFNFIVWLFLVYWSIKLIPKFKLIVAFIALLPITLQEATSLAPDSLTIGMAIFMVAYVLFLASRRRTISFREKCILFGASICISLCKIVYLPLVLLCTILPSSRMGSKKKKWIYVIGVILISAAANFIWFMISFNFIVETNPGVDAGGQVMGILSNPFRYLVTIAYTLSEYSVLWMSEIFGGFIAMLTAWLPMFYFLISFVIFVILIVQEDGMPNLAVYQKVICWATFCSVIVLVLTSLYVQWTPLGSNIIDGVQGRYFLPVIPILPVLFCRPIKSKKSVPIISENMVIGYSAFVSVSAYVIVLAQNL